jgi:hypothetical protein
MLEIRRILFPVHFSQRCSAAVSRVAGMARRFQAKLTLLHVIRTLHLWQRDLVSEEFSALVDLSPVWTDVHDEISFARLGWQSVLCAVDLRLHPGWDGRRGGPYDCPSSTPRSSGSVACARVLQRFIREAPRPVVPRVRANPSAQGAS